MLSVSTPDARAMMAACDAALGKSNHTRRNPIDDRATWEGSAPPSWMVDGVRHCLH